MLLVEMRGIKRWIHHNASIIDENVNSAKRSDHSFDNSVAASFFANILGNQERSLPGLCNEGLRLVGILLFLREIDNGNLYGLQQC